MYLHAALRQINGSNFKEEGAGDNDIKSDTAKHY